MKTTNPVQATIIGHVGEHIIMTFPDESVEPGHQRIAVCPADRLGSFLLYALTGQTVHWVEVMLPPLEIAAPDGRTAWVAPHDERTDARLVQLLDIVADLRFTAPHMLQLALEMDGAELDER